MKIANPLYDHAFKYLMANDWLMEEEFRNKLQVDEQLEILLAVHSISVNDPA